MKRWISRVCFVAPACMVVGTGIAVDGASASSGGSAGTVVAVLSGSPSAAAATASLPAPVVTPIDVPDEIGRIANSTTARGSLTQTISVTILPAGHPPCPAEALNHSWKCRPVQ